jgi:hypothetical protein
MLRRCSSTRNFELGAQTTLLPMCLLFCIGNYIVNLIAPEAVWPPGVDEESRS